MFVVQDIETETSGTVRYLLGELIETLLKAQ